MDLAPRQGDGTRQYLSSATQCVVEANQSKLDKSRKPPSEKRWRNRKNNAANKKRRRILILHREKFPSKHLYKLLRLTKFLKLRQSRI